MDSREIRARVQSDAVARINERDHKGIILVSPRVGKSKILIDSIKDKKDWNIVISSPFDTIRENWGKEWLKWNTSHIVNKNISSICHRSLEKIPEGLDLLVIDEVQTLSTKQIQVIKNKKPKRVLGLTGTLNKDTMFSLDYHLKLKVIYEYSIDQAIIDGIIANFEIVIVECDFDDTVKDVLSGTKKKSSWVTEKGHYDFLTKQFEKFRILSWNKPEMESLKMKYAGDRSRFIYESKSKVEIAKKIIKKSKRCLIFTGLQKIADTICNHSFHSKSEDNNLDKFISGEIDQLAVIDMVNMGITIPNLKVAVLHQLKSNSEMSLQKILRMCNLEDDLIATIYITVYKDSVDSKWTDKALETVHPSKIKRINYKNLNL